MRKPSPAVEFPSSDASISPAGETSWRTLPIDLEKLFDFLEECRAAKICYGWGAKIPSHEARPATDFTAVDCSGFLCEAIWRATTPHVDFPDGSVTQREWVEKEGFKPCAVADCELLDGAIRIAFLRPEDSPRVGVGHVVLIHQGMTIESHGSNGPNRRSWTELVWRDKAFVFLLTEAYDLAPQRL